MLPDIAKELDELATAIDETHSGTGRNRTQLWTYVQATVAGIGPRIEKPPAYDGARDRVLRAVEEYTGGKSLTAPLMRSPDADERLLDALKKALAAYSAVLEKAEPGVLY